MRTIATHWKKLFATIGALIMVVSIGATVHNVEPTEASWVDQVRGTSIFGMHPDAVRSYARGLSGHGVMERQITTSNVGPARAFATPPQPSSTAPLSYNDSGIIAALPLELVGSSCAGVNRSGSACGSVNLPPGTSLSSSEVSRLRLWLAGIRSVQLLAYGTSDGQQPISATATCEPGKPARTNVTAGGPVVIRGETPLYLPEPNRQTSTYHLTSLLTGITGIMQNRQSSGPGWAKAEVSLYVRSNEFLSDFTLHVILASAECGVGQEAPAESPRPTTSRPAALPESPNQPASRTASNFASRTAPAEMPAELPSLDDAAVDVAHEQEPESSENVDTTGTDTATTQPETTSTSESAYGEPQDQSAISPPTPDEPAPSEPATSEATVPTTVPAGPQEPELVRVGREFAVVNREGVELGTARIDDFARAPGCGVELALSIRTSAEAGPDRWASIGPGDFAEVRPGGAIREAGTVSSRTTALSAGREYEIVIAIALDDSAQQAMLRPDGTAGWIFDLPPLPKASATTSPSAPAPTASPATDPGEPIVETSVNTAEA